ncbi:MAG: hypothetical protein H5T73_06380 [Actinobacteria bacterium]|nr:hypothetical protein [Actinomycetota bacterium]
MRMVFFEADYYPYVWKELEDRLGVPISGAYIRGQKASVLDYLGENVLFGWRGVVLRRLPFSFLLQKVIDELAFFGFGHLELLEYRRHKVVLLRVSNAFDILSLAWGTKGFCAMVDGVPMEMAWTREGEDYLLTATPLPEGIEEEEPDLEALRDLRLAKKELAAAASFPDREARRETCPRCGVPSSLTSLAWKEEEGCIELLPEGRRVVFSTGHVMLGVLHELEKTVGRSLEQELYEITKNYHMETMEDLWGHDRAETYRELLERLYAWGYGIPLSVNFGVGHLELSVGNPFFPPRLAGMVAAVFEGLEGQEAVVEQSMPEPHVLEMQISTT